MKICQVGTGAVPELPGVTGRRREYVHYRNAALQRLGRQVTVIDMPTRSVAHSPYRRLEGPLHWRHDFNLGLIVVSRAES